MRHHDRAGRPNTRPGPAVHAPDHSMRRRALRAGLALSAWLVPLAAVLPSAARADDTFPSREIRLVVPWNAGGSNDIAARALSEILSREGIRVVVDNAPGATGTIGMQKVAIAEPDGYTIGMGTSSTLAVMAQGLSTLRNDQFAPIARVTIDPLMLLVPSQAPATTLDAFIARLKQNPGKLTIGTPGSRNLNHIFSVMAGRVAGVDIINVPYPGGAKVITDLAARQLDAAVLKPSESKGQIDAGLVKPIGVFADERLKALPDVPTFKERGYDVFPYGPLVQMAYLVAPARTPQPIQARLIEIFRKAIQSERFRATAAQGGSIVDDLTGAALGREIDAVQKTLGDVGSKVFTADAGK